MLYDFGHRWIFDLFFICAHNARIDGIEVKTPFEALKSVRFIETEGIPIPTAISETEVASHNQGHSLVLVAINDSVGGAIELVPTGRSEAKAVIQALRERHGITGIAIISGDHEAPTKKLASELGIDQYFAEVLPEDKANIIGQLQEEGRSVCYPPRGREAQCWRWY